MSISLCASYMLEQQKEQLPTTYPLSFDPCLYMSRNQMAPYPRLNTSLQSDLDVYQVENIGIETLALRRLVGC